MVVDSPKLAVRMVGRKGKKRPSRSAVIQRRYLDRYFMKLALKEAERAAKRGEVPVGCLIVQGTTIVARAHNRVEEKNNALLHAEMVAMERASQVLGWRLDRATMYVTLEPCVMCAGAAIHTRIRRIVFGAFDEERGGCGSAFDIPSIGGRNRKLSVEGGVMEEACSQLIRQFFRCRRETKTLACAVRERREERGIQL